jgi:TatD DNase family protein
LDYNRDFSPRPVQRDCFAQQISLAVETGLPLFLHERDAAADLSAMLKERREGISAMVVHCFTGTEEALEGYLELGAHIGITGWICDERRGKHLVELLSRIPLERLMIETDAPFLFPRDLREKSGSSRSGRNEPALLPHIAEVIAKHRGMELAEFAAIVYSNSLRFFRINDAGAFT